MARLGHHGGALLRQPGPRRRRSGLGPTLEATWRVGRAAGGGPPQWVHETRPGSDPRPPALVRAPRAAGEHAVPAPAPHLSRLAWWLTERPGVRLLDVDGEVLLAWGVRGRATARRAPGPALAAGDPAGRRRQGRPAAGRAAGARAGRGVLTGHASGGCYPTHFLCSVRRGLGRVALVVALTCGMVRVCHVMRCSPRSSGLG